MKTPLFFIELFIFFYALIFNEIIAATPLTYTFCFQRYISTTCTTLLIAGKRPLECSLCSDKPA